VKKIDNILLAIFCICFFFWEFPHILWLIISSHYCRYSHTHIASWRILLFLSAVCLLQSIKNEEKITCGEWMNEWMNELVSHVVTAKKRDMPWFLFNKKAQFELFNAFNANIKSAISFIKSAQVPDEITANCSILQNKK
jgi:hypothetical protein